MKYIQLESEIQEPVFSRQDLLLQGLKIYDYQLSLWTQKGYLIRLKNGLYAFARDIDRLSSSEVAYLIYQPSYISLENALSNYGLIPEMVYVHTCVTSRINRTFDNYFGRFIYRHIKKNLFWGFTAISTQNGQYLLAEPEKAVLDYLYLNLAQIRDQNDFDEIRFDLDQLHSILEPEKFFKYLNAFDSPKIKKWARQCLP